MMQHPTDLLTDLAARGLVAQLSDEACLRAQLQAGPVTLYTGYDPTAASLHVGHLVTLIALLHFQRAGHRVILLVGEGTARVGDPSGKSTQRPMLKKADIAKHAQAITQQIERFFPRTTPMPATETAQMLSNATWLENLPYIEFLRTIGRHFSVNRMLAAEAYKQRLARGLSFIEFNYQILQAYDFLRLHQDHGCTLQVGGDDQWGNIVAGIDLTRRVAGAQVYGLTLPLLTTATGEKMGKTQQGAVWLDAALTPPSALSQYFIDTHDDDVVRFLRLFTFLPLAEIEAVERCAESALSDAKRILAYEVCALVHGVAAAQEADRASFDGQLLPPDLLPHSRVPRCT